MLPLDATTYDSLRELREHLFLTGIAIVVAAGTVTLFGTWVVSIVQDAIEDFVAERKGELVPKTALKEVADDPIGAESALESPARAPDERHFES